ncbi:response regulator [Heliobacillus mobilis]|uniref:Stage 0 sporulation protein A homolog n=2 Tax=Heliobacterium TaxID=2697 RepID=Q0PIE7_HELMO|nr:response regulator [Heliobacterium mobile]ABH04870.1 CheY [Heliobacterium mobile]MBC9785303.1 response regulator [Heliobacterium chlorum]MTV49431.1 response regulator [Heliobacterium mobile]
MARILVVDDSAMVRKYHAFVLTSLGFEVFQSEDGCLALETMLKESLDLIITDINMPRMDGFQFIAEIRSMPAYRETPVIIVTTQDHQEDADRGVKVGANVYFIKPTEPEKLVDSVRRLLDGKSGKEA